MGCGASVAPQMQVRIIKQAICTYQPLTARRTQLSEYDFFCPAVGQQCRNDGRDKAIRHDLHRGVRATWANLFRKRLSELLHLVGAIVMYLTIRKYNIIQKQLLFDAIVQNLDNRYSGWSDTLLTDLGEAGATAAGEALLKAGFQFDVRKENSNLLIISLIRESLLSCA